MKIKNIIAGVVALGSVAFIAAGVIKNKMTADEAEEKENAEIEAEVKVKVKEEEEA